MLFRDGSALDLEGRELNLDVAALAGPRVQLRVDHGVRRRVVTNPRVDQDADHRAAPVEQRLPRLLRADPVDERDPDVPDLGAGAAVQDDAGLTLAMMLTDRRAG